MTDPHPVEHNANKAAHFQPPAPKPVQMKSAPFRPPVVSQQITNNIRPANEQQGIKEPPPKQNEVRKEETKEVKEIETIKKNIDYNNLPPTSTSMIEALNKMKNLFGVFEVNE